MTREEDRTTVPALHIGSILRDVRHSLIGGQAVNTWVEPRFTIDIDLIVDVDRRALDQIAERFGAEGLTKVSEHGPNAASIPDLQRFESSDRRVVVDIQIAKTALQRSVIDRAHPLPTGLRVATVEDLVVLKLIANRDKDARDLIDLCALPNIDWAYIEHWARMFDVHDRIAEYRK